MKVAAKVFIIIGMIAGFWYVLPLIFGFIALSKLKKATCKADIGIGFSICVLLFCSTLGGIFLLCLNDGHFDAPAVEAPAAPAAEPEKVEEPTDTL